METFKRIKNGVYLNETTGKKLLLRPVDRAYKNTTKKPVYFLSEILPDKKTKYISGMFKTSDTSIFSFDIKDNITGLKILQSLQFHNSGESITWSEGAV